MRMFKNRGCHHSSERWCRVRQIGETLSSQSRFSSARGSSGDRVVHGWTSHCFTPMLMFTQKIIGGQVALDRCGRSVRVQEGDEERIIAVKRDKSNPGGDTCRLEI